MSTVYHAAATCAMGRRTDRDAVVDASARVIGVKGLRVVDAGAFPFLPPGHPMGTVCTFSYHPVPMFFLSGEVGGYLIAN